jgi:N-methylhydantoinase B
MKKPGEPSFSRVDLIRQTVPEGSVAVIVTAGGGGWGDPLERDPERVRQDVVDDLVSDDAARDQYGVVLDATTRAVQTEATALRRTELKAARATGES